MRLLSSFLWFALCFFAFFAKGQNKVVNGGFEEGVESGIFPFQPEQVDLCKNWARVGTADWMHYSQFYMLENGSATIFGNNNSNGYVGMRINEAIVNKVTLPLYLSSPYNFSFWYRLPEDESFYSQNSEILRNGPQGNFIYFKLGFAKSNSFS